MSEAHSSRPSIPVMMSPGDIDAVVYLLRRYLRKEEPRARHAAEQRARGELPPLPGRDAAMYKIERAKELVARLEEARGQASQEQAALTSQGG